MKRKKALSPTEGSSKLLLVGDIHGGYKQAELAAGVAEKEGRDVFCDGDYLVDWHAPEDKLVQAFDKMMVPFTKGKSRFYTVNGNHDPDAPYSKAIGKHVGPSCVDMVGKLAEYDSMALVGFGGREVADPKKSGSGSPHGYSEIYDSLSSNIESAKSKGYHESDIALLLHEPAKGYLDVVSNGNYHIGGNAARDIVERYDAGLVISGHTHVDTGIEVRVREKGADYRLRLKPADGVNEEYDFHGAKITARGGKFGISYRPAETALTCFVNPGTLGYSNEYATLDMKTGGESKELSFDFRKL